MNHYIRQYLHSFKLKADFWYTFLAETITAIVLGFLFLGFGKLLNSRAYAISGGRSLEEFQQYLLSGSLDVSQQFLFDVRLFALLLVIGSLLLIMVSLFLFSLSQSLIWSRLCGRSWSKKRYWRWNLITFLLALIILPFFLVFLIVRVIVSLIPVGGDVFQAVVSPSLSLIFAVLFLFFLILAYFSFMQRYKAGESLGNVFHLLKVKWSSLWRSFFFTMITVVLLSVILYFFQKFFLLYRPEWQRTLVSLFLFLLFLSWMRMYLVNILKDEHTELSP